MISKFFVYTLSNVKRMLCYCVEEHCIELEQKHSGSFVCYKIKYKYSMIHSCVLNVNCSKSSHQS
jgi:hypothetical protein